MKNEIPAFFNDVIHSPIRLRICGILRGLERAEFQIIKSALNVSDATLSKNVKILADAGYLTVSKEAASWRDDARRLTWVALTQSGRDAFDRHFKAIQAIAEGSGAALDVEPTSP